MGVSTDALLVYGYVREDEADILGTENEEGPTGDDLEWPEIVAAQRGIRNPWADYPAEIEQLPYEQRRSAGNEWTENHRAELDAWGEATKAIESEYGVEIGQHGSDEWSVPVVRIANAGHRARRGDAHAIPLDALAVDPEWDGRLQRFIADLDIDVSEAQGPGWFLLSWWG